MAASKNGMLQEGGEMETSNLSLDFGANFTLWSHNSTDATTIVGNSTPPGWKLFIMYSTSIVIMIVNIPVFIVVPKRVPSLHRSMRYTMLSLAITDFSLGLSGTIRLLAFVVSQNYRFQNESFICKFDGYVAEVLASISILSLTWLSLDKLLIVRYPMRHKEIATKPRIILILLTIWVFILALFAPVVFGAKDANFNQNAYICIGKSRNMGHAILIVIFVQILPSIVIFTSFIVIYLIVRKSQQFRQKASTSTYTSAIQERQKESVRMIKTLVIMSSGYYIMWVPFFVCVPYWEIFTTHTLNPYTDFFTCWLGAANSMLNPLVYIPTVKPYRQCLFSLLRIRKKLPKLSNEGSGESRNGIVQFSKGEPGDPFSSN